MNAETLRRILNYNPSAGEFTWRVPVGGRARVGEKAGTPDQHGYVIIRYRGKGYKAHRLAWLYVYGLWPKGILDHKDGDAGNNSISNLREADGTLNGLNVSAPSRNTTSGRRGVSWFAQYQKWKASIQYAGRKYFLGHYNDPDEAEEVYLLAKALLTDGKAGT